MSYIGIVCNYISKGKKHIQMNSFISYKKNYFYFMLKAFCVLKIFKSLSWLFGHVEKSDLIWKKKFISNLWRHS